MFLMQIPLKMVWKNLRNSRNDPTLRIKFAILTSVKLSQSEPPGWFFTNDLKSYNLLCILQNPSAPSSARLPSNHLWKIKFLEFSIHLQNYINSRFLPLTKFKFYIQCISENFPLEDLTNVRYHKNQVFLAKFPTLYFFTSSFI